MKMLKSRKALSPVVASIILIAVTVAVSLAVAIWMGALSFTFMGSSEQLQVGTPWGWTPDSVNITVTNVGGSTVYVSKVRVNNTEYDFDDQKLEPKESLTIMVSLPDAHASWQFKPGYTYTFVVITKNNKEFPTTGTYTP